MSRHDIHLVHTTPPQRVQSPARHPDALLQERLHANYCAGFDAGERTFYPRGWRTGFFHGAFAACVGAVIAVCTFKALGWL